MSTSLGHRLTNNSMQNTQTLKVEKVDLYAEHKAMLDDHKKRKEHARIFHRWGNKRKQIPILLV